MSQIQLSWDQDQGQDVENAVLRATLQHYWSSAHWKPTKLKMCIFQNFCRSSEELSHILYTVTHTQFESCVQLVLDNPAGVWGAPGTFNWARGCSHLWSATWVSENGALCWIPACPVTLVMIIKHLRHVLGKKSMGGKMSKHFVCYWHLFFRRQTSYQPWFRN